MGWIVYSEEEDTVFQSRDNLQGDVWNWEAVKNPPAKPVALL
jgi:hypothetical protein